ncbi:hypothetical protein RW092_16075 [Paenibacillus sp. 3LSP]|uniref:Flagellar protein FliT n=1 Tax=Paenibacillus barengoltzii G22 TaxID=1235795 RepID=R9L5Z9_9BACL|nr:hypothetical protein C812_03741 [Paenibacillus barengoltzii G22]MDU0331705.1 hypothetical protein [Paenibacillus sp. 3LSP]
MTSSSVTNLLLELRDLIRAISALDLENEADYETLLSLQYNQALLRERIDQLSQVKDFSYTESDRSILQECIDLEMKNNEAFAQKLQEASMELKRINESRKSKNTYLGEYTQHVGYFIDSHQ